MMYIATDKDGFQPTPSSRRVTQRIHRRRHRRGFQPTPSSRRVTEAKRLEKMTATISTNTLLTEGDIEHCYLPLRKAYFNQHPPHGG